MPMPAAGTSAVVFEAVAGGEAQALRFFTRDDVSSAERYGALHEHFTSNGLEAVVALPRWVEDGIRVNGRTWPVVRMQWVEGHTLNQHVDELVERADTASLSALARSWRDLVTRIQRTGFAQGDLQHGNVLVGRGGELRLVDFDCSWTDRFSGTRAPRETGHRNYQPEHRPWGRWMGTFSGLVIYLSLLAPAKDPTDWRALHGRQPAVAAGRPPAAVRHGRVGAPGRDGRPAGGRGGSAVAAVLCAGVGGRRGVGRRARAPGRTVVGAHPRRHRARTGARRPCPL
ncbi:hypothetical protein AB0G02_39495, partial [Actinosynnema sp. NPDC023658]|uniref:hypothetical protein n=1 Tax=Actinosynnema sp. NPDC023658 TaxID=3155465 RepID=UPI0033E8B1F7